MAITLDGAEKSATTRTVACKIPNGFTMRLFEMVEQTTAVMGGGLRVVKAARQKGEEITLNGPAHPFGMAPNCEIVGGYALTHNVPADYYDEWLEQNKDAAFVRNRLIFAQPTAQRAEAQAREQREIRSGMEPLERDSGGEMVDPRVPKPITPLVAKIETANRSAL